MYNVLIIGFGKMGNIYSKYLKEFGIKWNYYDPYVSGGLEELAGLSDYTHVIISTISEVHYESYEKARELGFEGRVYIDKPVVISEEHLDIFGDENLFCGMTERYNPAVLKLKELLDYETLISIKFSRYSTVPENVKIPVLFDLGIHDLDLYLHLLGQADFPKTYKIFEKSKTCYIISEQSKILSIFEWSHESYRRERKITVLQNGVVYEADLIDQKVLSYEAGNTIRNLYVDKAQPLKQVMKNFLFGDSNDNARLAHEFMFDILRKK
jgi:predicted dehydrogenase